MAALALVLPLASAGIGISDHAAHQRLCSSALKIEQRMSSPIGSCYIRNYLTPVQKTGLLSASELQKFQPH
jgi:hypothetical protein